MTNKTQTTSTSKREKAPVERRGASTGSASPWDVTKPINPKPLIPSKSTDTKK